MNLKSTKTEKNLLAAFAGESMARNRYDIYAKKAKKEGYEQIFEEFQKIANQEKAHGQIIFNFLNAQETTEINLKNAAYGEHEEWATIYKEAAKDAYDEGFVEVGKFFDYLQQIEKIHEEKFKSLQIQVKEDTIFKGDSQTKWHCMHCGHEHVGTEPPKACPVCNHPYGYFEKLKE